MSALHLTMFRRLSATEPMGRDVTVQAIATRLGQAAVCPSRQERERTVPLWSPVRYREGTTRASRNVKEVHWLVLDYDDGTSAAVARERWSGWVHIGHTSYSHMQGRPPTKTHPEGRPPAPALRVVLPLREPVPADVWSEVMRGILGGLGQDADSKCIDPARMFYVPVVASEGAPFEHWVHMPAGGLDGPWLCLADEAHAARQAIADREREREERREDARRRSRERDQVASRTDRDREVRRRLLEDPAARLALGEAMGGSVVERTGGRMVIGVLCPHCSRPDVYWFGDVGGGGLRRARCNHRNSCGWEGHLWQLAADHGLTL